MRLLLICITLIVAIPAASGPVFAADSSLAGSAAPASGIAGAAKTRRKHHAKSAKTAADDKAKTDAAAAGTAGVAVNPAKTDPTVTKLNTVLPP